MDATTIARFYAELDHGGLLARGGDISTLKKYTAEYVNAHVATILGDIPNDERLLKLLDVDSREARGVQHDLAGFLICPIEHDWDDPVIRARVRAGEPGYHSSSSLFLRFLYKNYKGDKNKIEEGFLQSSLLLACYTRIYLSLTSVQAPRASNPDLNPRSVAMRFHLENKVTPRTIAYIAILVHFSLTNAAQWNKVVNHFSYHLFYNFIVDFFECPPGPLAAQRNEELLAWWNCQVYGFQNPDIVQLESSGRALERQQIARERVQST
ncbi:hypothetical protein BDN72DRAFT_864211 [Pluteus cervinus]|uniref:Uncharacterized protein n=1 Tax=Pluteus cervinus TaxID=181527 RepID=A0ACD3A5P8_9AGAR|nr:hypothetical protein BDN72DRAFT_864211 [Pluteus cervinus]